MKFFTTLQKQQASTFWQTIANQFTHPLWNGFHFYDLIFPLFLFIAGVATPYSVGRELEKGKTKQQVLWRVVKRGLILVILGIIYNNGLVIEPVSKMRFASVLGRIGLAYMFANIIYIYSKKQRTQIIWFFGILIGYWLMFKFTSAPGFPHGDLTIEGNFASYVDRLFLPGRLYMVIHDPEGIMSTIPAIATGLLGILTGQLLKNNPMSKERKAGVMAISGVILIAVALIWNFDFPINKNLWTSSFVLNVGGISFCCFRCFIISLMCWVIKDGHFSLKLSA